MKNSILFLFILCFSCCSNPRRYSYYFLNDNKIRITRIDSEENGLKTFLYIGDSLEKLPENYLYVKDKPLLGGFEALLTYRNDSVILIQPHEKFQKVGNNSIFIKEMESIMFYKIFFDKNQTEYIIIRNEAF